MKTRRLSVVLAILFGLVVTRPATAVPVDYILFDSSILADLGSFTADPAAVSSDFLRRPTGIGNWVRKRISSGIGFTLDFTPFRPADPSLIDRGGVGAYNLTAVSDDGPFDAAIGSVGIRTATTTVPEPSSAVLLGIALVASSMVRRSANAPR